MKIQHHILTLLAIVSFSALPCGALAGVGKVSDPSITNGEAEVEYSGTRYGDGNKAKDNKQQHTYELEYSFTDRFMLGIEAESAREPGKDHMLSAYGIEAQYQLTKQGDWLLDSAIKGEYGHAARHGEPDSVEMKLLAARTVGAYRFVGNVNFEQEIGSNHGAGLAVESQFQATRKMNEHINPGIEWHAEYGKLNKLEDDAAQQHYVGPIISGDLFELGGHDVEYTLGYYWGLNSASADNAARLQLGYEFAF